VCQASVEGKGTDLDIGNLESFIPSFYSYNTQSHGVVSLGMASAIVRCSQTLWFFWVFFGFFFCFLSFVVQALILLIWGKASIKLGAGWLYRLLLKIRVGEGGNWAAPGNLSPPEASPSAVVEKSLNWCVTGKSYMWSMYVWSIHV